MKRLSLFVAAMLFAVCSFAQLSIWNGSADLWTRGAGTQTSPYQIESAEQLAFIAEMVNAGVTTYENTYFKLMTNIDLNDLTWVPIGSSETNCFKGHLDGNNKTIFNNTSALFDYITDADIHRVDVEMEGIIGKKAIQSTINNCQYTGHRSMIGKAELTSISNCTSHIEIENVDIIHSAGIVDSTYACIVEDCYVEGYINSTRYSVSSYPLLVNCSYSGLCKKMSVGGICAVSKGSKYNRCLSNCVVYGDPEYTIYCAGILGVSCLDTITYCSNTAASSGLFGASYKETSGVSGGTFYLVYDEICHSGIIGVDALPDESGYPESNQTTHIRNSYTINESIYVINYVATRNANYGNLYTSLKPSFSNSYTSKDKTEAAMKSVSFPIILNTDSTVFIKDNYGVNDGYPIYKNQVYPVTTVADNIGFTSAQLNGNLYVENADSIGFEYKEKADATHWYRSVTATTSNTPVSHTISDLITGTEYVFRLWVEKEGVRYFGDTVSFTTLACRDEVTPISATICNGAEYVWADQTLTQAGQYRDTLTSSLGCDSIVELTLMVLPTNDLNKYDTIPTGETYDFYGEILDETGIYYHYVPAGTYCNLIILHLQVGESEGPQTAIDNIEDRATLPQKLLHDGQIYILRSDKTYTTTGAEVK